VNMSDCESDSEEEVEAHPLVPPVSPVAPTTRGSDSDSADEVEIRRDAPVTAMPEVAPAAQPAGQHLIGNDQSEQAEDHQPMVLATGRPVRTTRNATPHYASAAGRNPVQGGEGKCKRDRKGNRKGAMAAFKAAVNTPGPHSHALPPRAVAEAVSRPDADRWRAAIDEELASCREFKVWEEVHLPKGKQALPSFFIFETKRDGRYKAGLVAGGHRQRQGLDFEETYASVGSYRTMCMMMAIAAHEDLELRQVDVRTAFLNGWLKEEAYLRVPAGLDWQLGAAGKVFRLLRAIYGLRQATRAWNERLQGELARRGFAQSDADPSLWIVNGEGGAVLSLCYVDDGLVSARTPKEADALVDLMESIFANRKLGEPVDVLGIEIQRDLGARTITITQKAKAEELAAVHGAQEAGKAGPRVPMSPECFASLRAAQPGEPMAYKLTYKKVIGRLLHLAKYTRPDIALPVGALASYASAPSVAHSETLVKLVRYVGMTAGRGLTFGGSDTPVSF
jgi:hypothetical protein